MIPTELLITANKIIGALFIIFYAYQAVFLLVPFIIKPRHRENTKLNRFAVLIAARNEETVIAKLVESVKSQNYPSELIDVYVVADNCTDMTAKRASAAGAIVWERFDTNRVGKGYAMSFLLGKIHESQAESYDGYFVFDADNLLSANYIEEMNKVFSDEYPIVTGCRNSKNYGDTWISAGNALRFLKDSEYLNHSRMLLGTECSISGTGFLVSRKVLERAGGWRYFLISEDTEFASDCILHGEKIGYCHKAEFYDEQPLEFSESWRQRIRWTRGYMQVFGKYGTRMIRGFFRGKFSCYDVGMSNLPAMLLSFTGCGLWGIAFLSSLLLDLSLRPLFIMMLTSFIGSYLGTCGLAAFTTISKWKKIHAVWYKKVAFIFTYPIFMLSYIPISFCSMFGKVEWKPIKHSAAVSLREVVRG